MTWNQGVQGHTQIITGEVDICMIDATVEYFNRYIIRSWFSSFNGKRSQWCSGILCTFGFNCTHKF